MKTEYDIDTKAKADVTNEDGTVTKFPARKTKVTIDWDGLSEDETRELAARTIVIKWQNKARLADAIPEAIELKATDMRIGTRQPKVKLSVEDQFKALSPEDRAALIAKYS